MTNNRIIAVVGMCGSGKSVLADELVRLGWGYVRFGQLTIDEIRRRGLDINEENERTIREDLRKKHGMGAFAKLNIPKFDSVLENQHLVADGMCSWEEYKTMKDRYGDRLTIVHVYSPPELRYERLKKRRVEKADKNVKNRPLTKEQAKSRDYAEIENLDKGGPIAMADYTILNTGSLDYCKKQIEKMLEETKNK